MHIMGSKISWLEKQVTNPMINLPISGVLCGNITEFVKAENLPPPQTK